MTGAWSYPPRWGSHGPAGGGGLPALPPPVVTAAGALVSVPDARLSWGGLYGLLFPPPAGGSGRGGGGGGAAVHPVEPRLATACGAYLAELGAVPLAVTDVATALRERLLTAARLGRLLHWLWAVAAADEAAAARRGSERPWRLLLPPADADAPIAAVTFAAATPGREGGARPC